MSSPRITVTPRNRFLERTYDEAFPFDDDDEWIFDPSIDAILDAHQRKRTYD